MTPETIIVPARLLETVGKALYGPSWQLPLGKRLNVPARRMQRWAAAARSDARYPVSADLMGQLLGELERRVFSTQRAYDDLKSFYDGER